MTTEYVLLPVYDTDFLNFVGNTYGSFEGYEDALVRREDGRIVEVLHVDGGEPEDATLGRDFSWVLPALHEAYRRGVQDAR